MSRISPSISRKKISWLFSIRRFVLKISLRSYFLIDLITFFPQKDSIEDCRLIRNKGGVSRGYAYIDFSNRDAATASLENNGVIIEGKPLFVAFSAPPKKASHDARTLFLNNLPFKINERKLRSSLPEMVKKYIYPRPTLMIIMKIPRPLLKTRCI